MSEPVTITPDLVAECRSLADDWAPVLRALGNPERLLIVLWLAGTASTVRDLERVTGHGQSMVSYHLGALREAGLVLATPVGRTNQYRLANPELDKLAEMLGNFSSSADLRLGEVGLGALSGRSGIRTHGDP
jgi:ArsR family transcriptional regulator, arsenate/arsenite/antimonite-responsive transcriptional repressor